MKSIQFSYQNALVEQSSMQHVLQQIKQISQEINAELSKGYQTPFASLLLPDDESQLAMVQKLVAQKKALKPSMLVVIGIGGSNLGTMAVQQALFGAYYNEQQPDTKIYYADTVDSDGINDIVILVEQALEKEEVVLLNLISKSGTTTESIANFEVFAQLLRGYYGDEYHHYIIVTTDENSPLEKMAMQENFACLQIPTKVGGRFSVLSAVGLFTLMMIGVDVHQLLKGACDVVKNTLRGTEVSLAAQSAALLYAHYQKGIAIHTTFLFSVDLAGFGQWYRQLVAESLGKEKLDGQTKKRVGIVPIVSIGSTDLHSQVQLYIAGPRTLFTTFVTVGKNKSDLLVPAQERIEQLVPHIQGKDFATIMDAIVQGVLATYEKEKIPYCHLILPEKNEYYIGQLLQWKMFEIMYVGKLLQIDPFDQPQVELYKKETRKILAHE